jgi:hypothetical protein
MQFFTSRPGALQANRWLVHSPLSLDREMPKKKSRYHKKVALTLSNFYLFGCECKPGLRWLLVEATALTRSMKTAGRLSAFV